MLLEVFLPYLMVSATQCDVDYPVLRKASLVKMVLFDPFFVTSETSNRTKPH